MAEFPTRTVGPSPDAPPAVPTSNDPSTGMPPSLIGRVLSKRYRIDALIAEGGMGAVYSGEHVHMRKRVAIKLLHDVALSRPDIVARFEREAVAGAHVVHQNVAAASDFGQLDDGTYFLALEFVDGVMLRDVIARGPLPPARAVSFARQIASGLEAVHEKGIVHRDLKPRNVLVDERAERIKLIDFGLAKVPPELLKTKSIMGGTTIVPKPLTVAGMVLGTVAYMAPEAGAGMDNVDARADLYALGLVLYEMLTGKHPFDDTDPGQLFLKQRTVKPPPFAERGPDVAVPASLESLVMRLLEKKPDDRFASAAEVIAALDSVSPEIDGAPAKPGFLFAKRPASERVEAAAKRVGPALEHVAKHAAVAAKVARDVAGRARAAGAKALERAPMLRELPRSVYIGAGAILLTLVALVVIAARGHRDRVADDAREATSAAATAEATAESPKPSSAAREVTLEVDGADGATWRTRLRSAVDAKDWKGGAKAFLALSKMDPGELKAGTARENAVAVIAGIGVEQGAVADEVFDVLTNQLGPEGLDMLFDVVRSRGLSKSAKRADDILHRPEVMDRATPALRFNIEFRATGCEGKSSLYDRAVNEGDARTLAQLQIMHDADCDRGDRGRCCFKHDKALGDAIKALRDRLGIEPPKRR